MLEESNQEVTESNFDKKEVFPQSVVKFEGGTFTAWLAPEMKIAPKKQIFPYRDEVGDNQRWKSRLKELGLFDDFTVRLLNEVKYSQISLGLTKDRIDWVRESDFEAREWLYNCLQGAREKFVNIPSYLAVRDVVSGVTEEAKKRLDTDRRKYKEMMISTTKVSLRNFEWTKDEEGFLVLNCDYARTPYMAYATFRNPELPQDVLDLAMPTATAVILRTAGTSEEPETIAIQLRSELNRLYRKVPGASSAGLWDAELESGGKMRIPNMTAAKDNVLKEIGEEVGLVDENISEVKATGLAYDARSPHYEMLFSAKLKVTAREMLKISQESSALVRHPYGFDFSEKWLFIKGDRESLEKFLTQMRSYMPSTHTAVLVAELIAMKKREMDDLGMDKDDGDKQLQDYVLNLQNMIADNYSEIDNLVKRYWEAQKEKNPDLIIKNPNGFDPELLPEEQGLPEVESELTRLDLVGYDSQAELREYELPEKPRIGWMLDVDGVITNPETKQIDNEIIDSLAYKLAIGEIVTLNTGRSLEWVKKHVLTKLEEKVSDKKMMQGVCLVGEKGGMCGYYNQEGNWVERVNQNLVATDLEKIQDKMRQVAMESGFIFDTSKISMATLEMPTGWNVNEFKLKQEEVAVNIKRWLEQEGLTEYRIDLTAIALDVESKVVGKFGAAGWLVDLLKEKGVKPVEWVVIGDSRSDAEMRSGLEERGVYAKFVKVGGKIPVGSLPIETIGTRETKGENTQATKETLKINPALI